MPPPPLAIRGAGRVAEALVLSVLAALFVWLIGRFLFSLPIVSSALLGFLAGGAATLKSFGVTVAGRRRRAALAVAGAVLGWVVLQALAYVEFRHYQRLQQHAADYRLTAAEADRRVAADLVRATGHAGPVGYVLAALDRGLILRPLPLRLRGAWLVLYWLADLAAAASVAARWAAGPRPREAA